METDWSTMTFTMNWRIINPDRWVEFNAGDPVCFLQPFDMNLIETASPVVVDLADAPDIEAAHRGWSASRRAFNADPARDPKGWQTDYFLGTAAGGDRVGTHRTRVRVPPFAGAPDPISVPARLRPGGLHVTGGLTSESAVVTLTETSRRLVEQVPELHTSVRAALSVRLDVAADGRVHGVTVLSSSIAPLTNGGVPSDLSDRIVGTLWASAFSGGPGTVTFRVPIDDLPVPSPKYRQTAEFEFRESDTGFVITDGQGLAHELNPSAMFVLECCDGETEPSEIAHLVKDSFQLPDPPHSLVRYCLADLADLGLIKRD